MLLRHQLETDEKQFEEAQQALQEFEEVYEKGLEVMDMTAFTLCKENNLPIIVFDMNKKGNLKNLVEGQKIGTLVEV